MAFGWLSVDKIARAIRNTAVLVRFKQHNGGARAVNTRSQTGVGDYKLVKFVMGVRGADDMALRGSEDSRFINVNNFTSEMDRRATSIGGASGQLSPEHGIYFTCGISRCDGPDGCGP